MKSDASISAQSTRRILTFLRRGDKARFADGPEDQVKLVADGKASITVARCDIVRLAREELVSCERSTARITATGRSHLKRLICVADPFAEQHRITCPMPVLGREGADMLPVNQCESPLARLFLRKGSKGRGYLDEVEFRAGERFRVEFERACMMPKTTANWDVTAQTGRKVRHMTTDMSCGAIDARKRLDRVYECIGPDLWGLLIDVCCFLKGLESVEHERQWPQRSAKLVLKTGLALLAGHYGMRDNASPYRANRTRHWGSGDYRPQIR